MKKNILKVMIIMAFFCAVNVNAEAYYTNANGLEFSEFQYNAMSDILSEEHVKNLTHEEYDSFKVADMVEGKYEYVTQEFETSETPLTAGVMPYAYYETTSKKITLSKSCGAGSYCLMSVTATWKKTPAVTSYDVIGVRLENTSFYDSTNNVVTRYDSGSKSGYADSKKATNGLGDAVKIASDIDYMLLQVTVTPTSNGRVYASYQHAVKTVTLAKAINFTFSGTGYGSVFVWPSSYGQIYDQMGGVSLALS